MTWGRRLTKQEERDRNLQERIRNDVEPVLAVDGDGEAIATTRNKISRKKLVGESERSQFWKLNSRGVELIGSVEGVRSCPRGGNVFSRHAWHDPHCEGCRFYVEHVRLCQHTSQDAVVRQAAATIVHQRDGTPCWTEEHRKAFEAKVEIEIERIDPLVREAARIPIKQQAVPSSANDCGLNGFVVKV